MTSRQLPDKSLHTLRAVVELGTVGRGEQARCLFGCASRLERFWEDDPEQEPVPVRDEHGNVELLHVQRLRAVAVRHEGSCPVVAADRLLAALRE